MATPTTKKIDDLPAVTTGKPADVAVVSRGGVTSKVRLDSFGVSKHVASQLAATGSASFDPTLLPFSSHSPWRLGIAQDATFAADSDARNVNINNVASPNTPGINYYQYSHPVNFAATTDPLADVTDSFHPIGGTPTGGTWKTYIPATAKIASGSDRHMHVITPDKKDVIEHFGTSRTDSTHYTVTRRHRVSLRGSGIGPQNGTRAYGGSAIGGLIRVWEVDPTHPNYTGDIRHPLAMALRLNQLYYSGEAGLPAFGGIYDENGYGQRLGYVWPATEQDAASNTQYSGPIPMGSYFAIPPTVDITTLGLGTTAGLMCAKAMQDYGAYVTDASGTTALYIEDIPDGTSAASGVEGNFAAQLQLNTSADLKILFAALRVVTSNGPSTPNGGALGAARRGAIPVAGSSAGSTADPLITGSRTQNTAGLLVASQRNALDGSTAAFTATLPAPAKVGQLLLVERTDTSTANVVTIAAAAGATLRGSASATIAMPATGVANEGLLFISDSTTNWVILAGHKPKGWTDAIYEPIGLSDASRINALAATPSSSAIVTKAAHTVVEVVGNDSAAYSARIRPIQNRRSLRVINIGANPIVLGYSTETTNSASNNPTWVYTVPAGSEFFDTSGNTAAMFMKDSQATGLGITALIVTETY